MRNIRTQGNLAVRKNKIRMRRSAKQRLELLGQVETHSRIATHLLAAEPPHQQTQGGRKKKRRARAEAVGMKTKMKVFDFR